MIVAYSSLLTDISLRSRSHHSTFRLRSDQYGKVKVLPLLFSLDRSFARSFVQKQKSKVQRRYNDFVALHELLSLKYPFRIIPPLPPKKAVNGSFENLLGCRVDRHVVRLVDREFLEERRQALKHYLQILGRHPIICEKELMKFFLTYQGSVRRSDLRCVERETSRLFRLVLRRQHESDVQKHAGRVQLRTSEFVELDRSNRSKTNERTNDEEEEIESFLETRSRFEFDSVVSSESNAFNFSAPAFLSDSSSCEIDSRTQFENGRRLSSNRKVFAVDQHGPDADRTLGHRVERLLANDSNGFDFSPGGNQCHC